jgi:tetratricopeptide (TPR) repeat protein
MVQPLSTRDDLKTDPFQKAVHFSLEWIAAHRQTFFSIVGVAAAALLILFFTLSNVRNLKKQSWEKYFAGQSWMISNNPDQALNLFNDVTNNYSHTPAASYAFMGKGDILLRQRKFDEAIAAYQQSLEKSPPRLIMPFVLSSLGNAQEDKGDYAGAIESYKKMASHFPDHFLTPKVQESLGRVYELSLNPDAAKEIYEKIITLYPNSIWSERARVRYQSLSPQPFGNSNQKPPTVP